MRTIDEIIFEVTKINDNELKTARYSVETASKLLTLSDELKEHARLTNQCCY